VGVNSDTMQVGDAKTHHRKPADVVPQGHVRTERGAYPRDWDVQPLGSLSSTGSGTTPPRALAFRYFHNGSVYWLKTLDLNNSVVRTTEERITQLAVVELGLRLYPVGAVVVAMYGGFAQIGRTGLLSIPSTINQALTAVIPSKGRLDSCFLLQVLNYRIGYWKTVASSSRKDPNITRRDVREFCLPVPAIEEQRAIAVALLDVDGLLEALEALIAKKRAIKRAVMQQLLTGKTRLPGFSGDWEVKPFRLVLERLNTKDSQIQTSEYQVLGRFPVIDQGKQSTVGFSDRGDCLFKCPSGGVIVFGDHTCIAKFVDFDFVVGADGTQIIKARDAHVTRFFAYHLQYRGIQPTGYNRHFKFLRAREFDVPEPAEQSAIVNVLSDMDAEVAALEASRDKTRAIKQGMMQQLLTGRTRLVETASART
jgi:type I restriction enzyme, S subunit